MTMQSTSTIGAHWGQGWWRLPGLQLWRWPGRGERHLASPPAAASSSRPPPRGGRGGGGGTASNGDGGRERERENTSEAVAELPGGKTLMMWVQEPPARWML